MRKVKQSLVAIGAAIVMTTTFTSPSVKAEVNPIWGQLMMVGAGSCPRGWVKADGQLIEIQSNSALFSLYGTTYGGDSRTIFGVPDLRGRMAIGVGNGPGLRPRHQGEKGGQESVELDINSIPQHSHTLSASSGDADTSEANGAVLASADIYRNNIDNGTEVYVGGESIGNSGGAQAHNNMAPYRAITYCIATQGVFPSRS
ncbi:MAG: microcystin-dependent protein [Parasphingorhabdus sp.]|jgi:microcystin-dependent protein